MGSVGLGNTALLGAFNNRIIAQGLDLGRCQINQALGVYVADPAQTFSAGMIVGMNTTTGLVEPSAGTATHVLGVAKWNHLLATVATVVDEPQVFPLASSGTFTLNNPNVVNPTGGAASIRIWTGLQGTGTQAVVSTDFTLNAANGVVTAVSNSTVAAGTTVYVTYAYQVTAANLYATYGENFWNNLDEVSMANGRVTVITDAELLFTAAYDTLQSYTQNQLLYAATGSGLHGLFTNQSTGSALKMGVVFQVPTASDPFLGVRLVKAPGSQAV